MNDLLEQLQAHLGSRFRIERELGGGGMSRVYLAEELGLARKVVIKVLPPGLGPILSEDRFQREVRLAASLQHPHVVTLLTAGGAGELLYYTMPFVEGESLRARLDREGEIPVPDVIRILREVADGLAYAHRQGVVHRDIKPDNVLMSHHHAVVTDFGIAKALSAADEGGKLTETGISIGTPTYMAPEQATADRVIDGRADIYSVGVLAFELLTGEPPFRGPTAQAVIAGHLTRTPQAITELRPSVPAELAAIVGRCLEKHPADRFQSAEALLSALEVLGSSAPGPTGPTSAGAAGTSIWPLPRVLGYFGMGSAAVLGLAWGLRTLLGLPDWFFAAAVVLVAIGLPVMVAATLAHNRRVSRPSSPIALIGKRLTLRRAVSGGVAAFIGLGLVTAGYMGMRVFGIGPVGTLVASGQLEKRDRLVIADFANHTRDSLLGPAVTQAFRVDFAQSRLVSPVEADYVRRVLSRMQRPDSLPLDLSTAREIAQRAGFKAVIAGELQQVGPSILVSAQLIRADSGQVLVTARATARDSTGILDAVDQVSKKLRNRIGESLRATRENPPLADVTTGSLAALRQYSHALQAEGRGDYPAAIALLEEAVAADAGFAMAWRKLGTMLNNAGIRRGLADSALTRAFALREHLTFRERKLTEDSYYMDVREDADSAAAVLQSLLAEYPDDSWAYNNLGVAYEMQGNQVAAERAYLRAATLEPELVLSWGNVLSVRIAMGRYDSAAATLALIKSRFPPGPTIDDFDVGLDLGRRDFVTAEAKLRTLISKYQAVATTRDRFTTLLGGVLALRGKLAEADRTLAALAELREGRGNRGRALDAQLRRVWPAAMLGADVTAARSLLDRILRTSPIASLPVRERPEPVLIRALIAVGDQERANRALADLDRDPGALPRRAGKYVRLMLRGHTLALEKRTLPQAIAVLQQVESFCGPCVDAAIADGFDRLGAPDSALTYYQRWADAGLTSWSAGVYNVAEPGAYLRMGELYEARGDIVKAIDFYGRLTELWRDADPGLQSFVREARRRIAELQKVRG